MAMEAAAELMRTEKIGGTIFNMSPRPTFNHNKVAGNLFNLFENFLEDNTCEALAD